MSRARIWARPERGGMILGFSALIFVLGVMCSIVLLRSLESYRATATAAQRMQARAAAEGAAVLLTSGESSTLAQPVRLGDCAVTGESGADGQTTLTVRVSPKGSTRPALELRYRLTTQQSAETSRTIARLELQP